MELAIILKALLSLGLVFALMYGVLRIIRKYTVLGFKNNENNKTCGLKIENLVYIDENTKIVNIGNANGTRYIIAVGKNNSFLIDKYTTDKKND